MQADVDKRFIGRVMKDRQSMEKMLVARARPIAARLAAITPRRSGETATSTSIETGHRNATGDRVAVRIVQRGAAIPQNFGRGRRNRNRNYMLRAL